jgi:hypothetical protein
MCLALNPGVSLCSGTSPSRMGGIILGKLNSVNSPCHWYWLTSIDTFGVEKEFIT